MPLPLLLATLLAATLAAGLVVVGARMLGRGGRLAVFLLLLGAVVCLTAAGIALTLGVGAAGYRAVSEAAAVAEIAVRRTGVGAFTVSVRLPDGRETSVSLAGDTLVVEAFLLRWRPPLGLLGLRTAYRLGQVEGRGTQPPFGSAAEAFSLGDEPPVDLDALSRRLPPLRLLFEVEHRELSTPIGDEPETSELLIEDGGITLRRGSASAI